MEKIMITLNAQEKEAISIVTGLLLRLEGIMRLEGKNCQTGRGIDINHDEIASAVYTLLSLYDEDKVFVK